MDGTAGAGLGCWGHGCCVSFPAVSRHPFVGRVPVWPGVRGTGLTLAGRWLCRSGVMFLPLWCPLVCSPWWPRGAEWTGTGRRWGGAGVFHGVIHCGGRVLGCLRALGVSSTRVGRAINAYRVTLSETLQWHIRNHDSRYHALWPNGHGTTVPLSTHPLTRRVTSVARYTRKADQAHSIG